MPGHAHVNKRMLLDCPSLKTEFFLTKKKHLATVRPLSRASLLVFRSHLFGRKNEVCGKTSEAPAEPFDFLPKPGLALPLRKGTSSS